MLGVHMLLLLLTLSFPVDQAITDLGDMDWRVRERASFVLHARMDPDLYKRLRDVRKKTDDLEVAFRLEKLLDSYQPIHPYQFFRRLFP